MILSVFSFFFFFFSLSAHISWAEEQNLCPSCEKGTKSKPDYVCPRQVARCGDLRRLGGTAVPEMQSTMLFLKNLCTGSTAQSSGTA